MRRTREYLYLSGKRRKKGEKELNEATPFFFYFYFLKMSETSVSNVRHLSVWRRSFGRRPTAGSLLWLSAEPSRRGEKERSINSFHIFQQLNGSDWLWIPSRVCCCNSVFFRFPPRTIPSPRNGLLILF
jgi:hypothetical protein